MKSIEDLGISPAPWAVGDNVSVCDNNCAIISGQYGPYNWSNARLIAAAPDLYEALRKMQEFFDYIRSTAWFLDANFASILQVSIAQNEAKAALAKAIGDEVKE